jgi:hypothetical protein
MAAWRPPRRDGQQSFVADDHCDRQSLRLSQMNNNVDEGSSLRVLE